MTIDWQIAIWGVGIVFGLGLIYAEILTLKRDNRAWRKMLLGNGEGPMFVTANQCQNMHIENKEKLYNIETRLREIEMRTPRFRGDKQ